MEPNIGHCSELRQTHNSLVALQPGHRRSRLERQYASVLREALSDHINYPGHSCTSKGIATRSLNGSLRYQIPDSRIIKNLPLWRPLFATDASQTSAPIFGAARPVRLLYGIKIDRTMCKSARFREAWDRNRDLETTSRPRSDSIS